MDKKRFYLSEDDEWFCGVCGGIAEYFDIDSFLIRIIFVLLLISSIGTPVVVPYFLIAFFAPEQYEVVHKKHKDKIE